MKLTPAEYKLLDALNSVEGGYPIVMLRAPTEACANRMRLRGLISKRAWTKGYVVATALGKRSHARGGVMGTHEQCIGATDEWYTPPHVFEALGVRFDMDVATTNPPVAWVPTSRHLWDLSLEQGWDGFVWMNPPFGARNGLVPWLNKFFTHNNGIALVPDRTSAPWWQRFAPFADSILFVAPKLKFIGVDGKPGASPAQGTCLMAAGERAIDALNMAQSRGLGVLMAPMAVRSHSYGR